MKAFLKKIVQNIRPFFRSDDSRVSNWDETMLRDYYAYNLRRCIMASAMICTISLTGLLGIYAPFSTGAVIPVVNAALVYLTIFTCNLFFLLVFHYVQVHCQIMAMQRLRGFFVWFTGIDMSLAALTFFTTQQKSGFFFEYLLITVIVYLLPNMGSFSLIRNMTINILSVSVVLLSSSHKIAWQDIVDLSILHIICAIINRSRRLSFYSMEKQKASDERTKDQFYHDSRTDELTSLSNRTALKSDVAEFLNSPISVALLDLDFFKTYNDTYGHEYGDNVLQLIGVYIRDIFHGQNDHCYRYGGDEFLIITESEDPVTFRSRLEKLQELCASSQDDMEITCSIGFWSDLPQSGEDLREMIRDADQYLYQAKKTGHGQIDGGSRQGLFKTGGLAEISANTDSSQTGRDTLTGLMDIRTFLETMRSWRIKERDLSTEGELVVLYFDLINFRMINLLYGMAYGDDVLRNIGGCLKSCFENDPVSHWDVDHFVILTNTLDLEKRVGDAVKRIKSFLTGNVECSVGACVWNDHSLNVETVCNRAKAAADESRKKIGLHFSYYSKAIGDALQTAVYVVSHIDEAISRGWILVYYQPVVRALTGQICGMEALARWKDLKRGLLPPISFIKPLEEARLIYKLDLCVIRQVVEQIADRYHKNQPEIPISINLSRLDFLCCDIYQEIENLVREYKIPRRMLHLEVTESIMMSDEDDTLKALQSFREAGYEIWMDDFGSGYSTLNLLKDYQFDLLKMDMVFLRKDSDRSHEVIRSIIDMDKRLGIRTLAEGVETEEQADFLRKSGCEKLQGYYFAPPMPFQEALDRCLSRGIGVESAQQKICYDALSRINFMTDIPILVWEVENHQARILFANDPALRQIHLDGFSDPKAMADSINDRNNIASRELAEAIRSVQTVDEYGDITTYFNGIKQVMHYQMIGSFDDTRLFVTKIYSPYSDKKDEIRDQFLMSISYLYRYLYSIDADHMTLRNLRFNNHSLVEGDEGPVMNQGQLSPGLPEIYEEDQKRYKAFLDPSTLIDRLAGVKYNIIRDVFRTKGADGTYIWMAHRLLLVPNMNQKKILYLIRTTDLPSEIPDPAEPAMVPAGNISRADHEYDREIRTREDARLFDSMIRHVPLPLFWKDKDRRFLGVSQSFLDYYGFSSVNELLGKTDEEIGWHPNNEDYKKVEQEVLMTGKARRNVPGKCIAKGIVHEIYATKWPVFQDGRVSGLMGYFLDADLIRNMQTSVNDDTIIQTQEDLSSTSHFFDVLTSYKTDYQLNQVEFGVLYIEIPELERIAKQFGHAEMWSIRSACTDVVSKVIQNTGSYANLEVGLIGVILSLQEKKELQEKADQIREGINAIHEVQGIPCSLFASVTTCSAQETMLLSDRILSLLNPGDHHDRGKDGHSPDTDSPIPAEEQPLLELMNEMPVGCYVLKPDHTVLYWNQEAENLLGFSSEEMCGRICIDMPLGCSFVNGTRIPRQFCPAVVAFRTGKPCSMQMFFRKKDGNDLLVRNILMPLKQKDGRVTELMSFFFPLVDKDYDTLMVETLYETATRDPLTCLPGRKFMEKCIKDELESFHRTKNPFAILFADADYLHDINNRLGHEAGDAMLREIGLTLQKYGRKADRFCRWGGDEFVGLLQLNQPHDIEGAARRLKKVAEGCEIEYNGRKVSCQAAIGITVVREDDDMNSLINRADQYMYLAKKHTKTQIVTDYHAEGREDESL